tara:strand:- start:10 stop:147 length:138 start_codon:yes stop_codon:yes gene_type:complete
VIDSQRWLATAQKKSNLERTMMTQSEVSKEGMKDLTHKEQSQTEL